MFLAEPRREHRSAWSDSTGAMGTQPRSVLIEPQLLVPQRPGVPWGWNGSNGRAGPPPTAPTRGDRCLCKGSCRSCEPSQGTAHSTWHLQNSRWEPLPAPIPSARLQGQALHLGG